MVLVHFLWHNYHHTSHVFCALDSLTDNMMKVEQIYSSEKKTCPEHFLLEILEFLGEDWVMLWFLHLGKCFNVAVEKEPFGVPAN